MAWPADGGRGVIGTSGYTPAPPAWARHTIREDLWVRVQPAKTADQRSRRPVRKLSPIKPSGGDQLSLATSLATDRLEVGIHEQVERRFEELPGPLLIQIPEIRMVAQGLRVLVIGNEELGVRFA